jgi:iron complex transport system substrate-binding protein
LMMSHTLDGIGGPAAAAALPAIAVTPAGRDKRIAAVDGNFHLGFGPRLPAAITQIARRMRGLE